MEFSDEDCTLIVRTMLEISSKVERIDEKTDNQAKQSERLEKKIDDNQRSTETKIGALNDKIDSLETSRDEAKGSIKMIGGVSAAVAAVVSFIWQNLHMAK